jgi:hypothetical protein
MALWFLVAFYAICLVAPEQFKVFFVVVCTWCVG